MKKWLSWAFLMVFGLLFAVPVLAQEAAKVEAPAKGEWWEVLLAVVAVPVLGMVFELARSWAGERKAARDKARAEGNTVLRLELEAVGSRIVSNFMEREVKAFEELAKDGKITKQELQEQKSILGEDAKKEIVKEFKAQGLDVVKKLGEEKIKSVIRNVVDKLKARRAG